MSQPSTRNPYQLGRQASSDGIQQAAVTESAGRPFVSIVLPTYNGSRYLAKAIESCINQTYTNWELIIVDDGSTDDTPKIVAEYEARDDRIKSIRHDENRNLPAALNTGFAMARGDLLTWTSDDNQYRQKALSSMVEFLLNNPDVDVVYTDRSLIDEHEKSLSVVVAAPPDDLPFTDCVGACFMYRRAVHESLGGYNEEFFMAEDYEFWLRAYGKFTFGCLHEDLYLYRMHGGSLTEAHVKSTKLASRKVLEKYLTKYDWRGRIRGMALLTLASDAAFINELRQAGAYLAKALLAWPPIMFKKQTLNVLIRVLGGPKGFDTVYKIYQKVIAHRSGRL